MDTTSEKRLSLSSKTLVEVFYMMLGIQYLNKPLPVTVRQWQITGIETPVKYKLKFILKQAYWLSSCIRGIIPLLDEEGQLLDKTLKVGKETGFNSDSQNNPSGKKGVQAYWGKIPKQNTC